jgi:hypothetical protein
VHEQTFIAHLMTFAACLGDYSKEQWPHCDGKDHDRYSFYSNYGYLFATSYDDYRLPQLVLLVISLYLLAKFVPRAVKRAKSRAAFVPFSPKTAARLVSRLRRVA